MDFNTDGKKIDSNISKQSYIAQTILNAYETIHLQMKRFIEMVDEQLLTLQNFLQQNTINILKVKTNFTVQSIGQSKKEDSQKQRSKLETILNHTINKVTQQVCTQIQNITKRIIPQKFSTIKQLSTKGNNQLNQLKEFYDNFLSLAQSNTTNNQPELNCDKNQQQAKINKNLNLLEIDNFFLKHGLKSNLSNIWNNKLFFDKHSLNMELIESNKIKSIDAKSIKEHQNKLLIELTNLRNRIQPDSQQTHQNQSKLKLKSIYQALFDLNRHFIVYQNLAWPQINPNFYNKNNDTKDPKQSNDMQFHQYGIIQFKLQAQGFTLSNNKNLQSSIRKKLSKTLNDFKNFSQFEQTVIKQIQQQQVMQEDKFFQFGLIDDLNSLTTICQKSQKVSIKIINIEGKFFIQSLNQAKLIQLNPLWEYFGIKIMEQINKDQASLIFYGLVKKTEIKNDHKNDKQKQKRSQTKNQYQKQNFVKIHLSPKLKNKVLKPFFFFKGFSCRITIKND